jgi:hypothetical protein
MHENGNNTNWFCFVYVYRQKHIIYYCIKTKAMFCITEKCDGISTTNFVMTDY